MGLRTRAVIVPDERTWLVWGRDLRAEGHDPVDSPHPADALVVPRLIPENLSSALVDVWSEMPSRRRLVVLDGPYDHGVDAAHAIDPAHMDDGHHTAGGHAHDHDHPAGDHHEHAEHGGHAHDEHHHGEHEPEHGDHDHHEHGGHDHHAMMAVTGDPSADGLVMENLDVTVGPVSAMLPGGVVGHFELDGDVVCAAHLRATLAFPAGTADPSAPAAWSAARAQTSASQAAPWLVAVELERALSHASWLTTLGQTLGWAQLADRTRALARAILAVRVDSHATAERLDPLVDAARRLADRLDRSARLAFSLRNLATLTPHDAATRDLAGPNARASGIATDLRTGDPVYEALGFRPVVREEGDARARALVRAHEIVTSLELVAAAARRTTPDGRRPSSEVEGPRGPVSHADHAAAALAAAGSAAAGLEWSAAIAAIVSFDLSGWVAP